MSRVPRQAHMCMHAVTDLEYNCIDAYVSQHISYAHIFVWSHILSIHRCFRSKSSEIVSQSYPSSFKKFSQAFGAEVPKRTNPVLSWSGHTVPGLSSTSLGDRACRWF